MRDERRYHCAKQPCTFESVADTFWTNPQYSVDVIDPDDSDSDRNGTLIIAVMQKERRKKKLELGLELLTIGYSIYRVRQQHVPHPPNILASASQMLSKVIGPVLWGHSGPLCHALSLSLSSLLSSLSWTSMRRRRATVATPGEWQCKTLTVANGPNNFQMLLVIIS